MNCSPFDLREYFLKELSDPQQRQVEIHVKGCQSCFEELEQLRLTEAALFSLREEEIPQRIAFVSDKIFEPSPLRRWLSAFWASGARLGFAGAAMLSIAILVSAMTRPAPAPVPQPVAPTIVRTVSDAEIQAKVDAAVQQAVARLEKENAAKNHQLVAELDDSRRRMLWAASEFDRAQKHLQVIKLASYIAPMEQK